jgi:branched-chain amino acid transport system permease protein
LNTFIISLGGTIWIAAIYALMGVGLVLIFRTTLVLNFANPDLGLLSTYFMVAFSLLFAEFWLGLIVGLIATGVMGVALYFLLMKPLAGRTVSGGIIGPLAMIMVTFSLSILIEAVIPLIWGTDPKELYAPIPETIFVHFGLFRMTTFEVVTVAVALIGIGGFSAILRYSRVGVTMRATASNAQLASRIGINVHAVNGLSWALGLMFTAIGAAAFANVNGLSPATTSNLGLAIFPVIIIGGLDSVPGVLIGAIVLALVQTLSSLVFGGNWSDVSSYVLLLLLLLVKPRGIFGQTSYERV